MALFLYYLVPLFLLGVGGLTLANNWAVDAGWVAAILGGIWLLFSFFRATYLAWKGKAVELDAIDGRISISSVSVRDERSKQREAMKFGRVRVEKIEKIMSHGVV